jgi:hypothetical protein
MIYNLFLSAIFIAALSLLARITLNEPAVEKAANRLPYILQKPLTCGVCRTFWFSFFAQFFFLQFETNFLLPYIQGPFQTIGEFLLSWVITGMTATAIFYVVVALDEGAHYLSHKVDEMHKKLQ